MAKYYVDTCIWRDFYEDRFSRSGSPLGEYATKLFMKIIKNKDSILFSEPLVWELKKDYSMTDIHNMLNFLSAFGVLVRVEISKAEHLEAKRMCNGRNLPFIDCLHAVQARNHGAVIVSQDRHFFENLHDVAEAQRPQDII